MLILRPASWLALLSRTFTFELSLTGSPQANVEYDYVGKQSIPTTGLSPASPTALWAAEIGLTPSGYEAVEEDPEQDAIDAAAGVLQWGHGDEAVEEPAGRAAAAAVVLASMGPRR